MSRTRASSPAELALIEPLSAARRVLITTHVRPDGDALGTTAALSRGLRANGIDSTCLLLSDLPAKYAFLYDGVPHHVAPDGGLNGLRLDDFDALLVADTGTWSQLPGLKEAVTAWAKPKLVLDHHRTQQDWATAKLVDVTAASATELAADFLDAWGVPLDPSIATCLYAGLVTDTGWFQYSSVTARTFRLAARLRDAGADHDGLYERIYQSESAGKVFFHARGLATLALDGGGRVASMQVGPADRAAAGAGDGASEGLVNVPLQIAGVEASALFNAPDDAGPVRVSVRTKGELDAAAFAQRYGGGGHARAAGLRVEGPVERVRRDVVAAMVEALGPV